MTKTSFNFIVLAAVLAFAVRAQAEYGVNVTGNGPTNTGDWTLGYEFTVGGSPIAVDRLGYFDFDQDGFVSTHEVGIWNMSGTLLASATVDNSSTVDAFFRWTPITPITLNANTSYKVAGTTGSDSYSWENPGFTVGDGITFVTDVYKSGGFGFPDSSEGRDVNVPGIFGGNIDYHQVPEASTFTLAALGLSAAGCRRFRR